MSCNYRDGYKQCHSAQGGVSISAGVGSGGGGERCVGVKWGDLRVSANKPPGYQPISHPVWTGRSHAKFTEPKLTWILRTVRVSMTKTSLLIKRGGSVSMTKTSLLIKRGGSEHDQNFASNKAGRQ